jgi:hypothetical protein
MGRSGNRRAFDLGFSFKSWLHLIALIALLSLQVAGLPASVRADETEERSQPPLILELRTSHPVQCVGSWLDLQAELKNVSDAPILVDPVGLWYRVSVTTFRSSDTGGGGASKTFVGDHGPDGNAKFIVLTPGEVYTASRRFSLKEGFFSKAGVYNLTVAYGQFQRSHEGAELFVGTIQSNEVEFQLVSCNKKGRVGR